MKLLSYILLITSGALTLSCSEITQTSFKPEVHGSIIDHFQGIDQASIASESNSSIILRWNNHSDILDTNQMRFDIYYAFYDNPPDEKAFNTQGQSYSLNDLQTPEQNGELLATVPGDLTSYDTGISIPERGGYGFQIRAIDARDRRDNASKVIIIGQAQAIKFQGLEAKGVNLANDLSRIDLSWEAAENASGTLVYEIYLGVGFGKKIAEVNANQLSWSYHKPQGGVTYTFGVRARDDFGYDKNTKTVDIKVAKLQGKPTFGYLKAANEAGDGYLTAEERLSKKPMFNLSAESFTSAKYTAILADFSQVKCNDSQSYIHDEIPLINTTPAANSVYGICVKLINNQGQIIYGKSQNVDATNKSLVVMLSDVSANQPIYISTTIQNYKSLTWSQVSGPGQLLITPKTAASPQISATSDGSYTLKVSVKGVDGQSLDRTMNFTWDTAAPVLSSLNLAYEAIENITSAAEAVSQNPAWALSATGYDHQAYSLQRGSLASCSALVAGDYNLSSIPLISELTTDDNYLLCVRLWDNTGNVTTGTSQVLVRDADKPTFKGFIGFQNSQDYFISYNDYHNPSASATNLGELSATDYDSSSYSSPISHPANCDSSQTYSSSIPNVKDIPATSGSYVVCVQLEDNQGNIAYGTSKVFTLDLNAPSSVTNLTATAGAGPSVNLDWDATPDSESHDPDYLVIAAGTSSQVAGKGSGYALSLDGSSALQSAASIDLRHNQLSLSTWVTIQAADISSDHTLIHAYDNVNNNQALLVKIYDSGRVHYSFGEGSATKTVCETDATDTISTDTWVHIAITNDLNYSKIYIDGTLKKTCVFAAVPDQTQPDRVFIGAENSTPTNGFKGSLDELYIFHNALSAVDIQYLYQNNQQYPASNYAHYWSFEESSASYADANGGVLILRKSEAAPGCTLTWTPDSSRGAAYYLKKDLQDTADSSTLSVVHVGYGYSLDQFSDNSVISGDYCYKIFRFDSAHNYDTGETVSITVP